MYGDNPYKYNSQSVTDTFRSVTRYLIPLFSFSLIMLFAAGPVSSSPKDDPSVDFYKKGLKEKQEGNFDKALEIWMQAEKEMPQPDFKIGQSFIELVTERKMKSYYEKASELFYWGLNSPAVEGNEQALIDEVNMIRPIVGYSRFKKLKNKVEDGNVEIFEDIKTFWNEIDPTPFTPYNERLIEHWERVAHSRVEYDVAGSNGMDDRSSVYIKYGKPDYTRSGQITYNSGTVNYLLDTKITGNFPNSRGNDLQNQIRSAQQFNMETNIRMMHDYPRYEVWIYNRLTEDPDNTIFIFGTGSGSNTFHEMKSVEDFIPSEAFSQTGRNRFMNLQMEQRQQEQGMEDQQQSIQMFSRNTAATSVPDHYVTPAIIMQIMYYEQFAALDDYFGSAYNKMINRYMDNTVRLSKSLAREFESIHTNQLIKLQKDAPEEESEYEQQLVNIPIESYTYRFLDEQDETYVKLFVNNNPDDAAYFDHLKSGKAINNKLWRNYNLVTGIQVTDDNKRPIKRELIDTLLNPQANRGVQSVYDINYRTAGKEILIASELHKASQRNDSTLSDETPFRNSLKGMGKHTVSLPEPLPGEGLLMGDVVVGFNGNNTDPSGFVPFTIAHNKTIPKGRNLNIFYELYHLEKNAGGRARFTFTYRIISNRAGLLSIGPDKDQLSITLNNETLDNRYSQVLDIDTSSLNAGRYKMEIAIHDLVSGEEIKRTVDFDVK